MNGEPPIARLRPGGRDDTPEARSHMVAPGAQPTDATSGRTVLREWHSLTPTQRKAAWVELVEWAVWLYDRYELSVEHRLPDCWAEHPGLVEELLALKVWREQIYGAEEPAGQAARYWHTELRQVLNAATTFYAKGCRAGHKTASALATADNRLRQRWLGADPLVGVPPALLRATDSIAGDPTLMSDPQMRAAIADGTAEPLAALIGDYQHFQGVWWMNIDGSQWQQITDPLFAAELDASAKRMRATDDLYTHARHHRPEPGPGRPIEQGETT